MAPHIYPFRGLICAALTIVLSAAVLLGCEKKDVAPVADSSAMMPPAPPAMDLAGLAGQWNMEVLPADRDTVILTYGLNATADTAGWTMTFPGRDPLPFRIVMVSGDSMVAETGLYESMLRKGAMVSTRAVSRMRGDTLVTDLVATYASGADSVVRLRARGTRAP